MPAKSSSPLPVQRHKPVVVVSPTPTIPRPSPSPAPLRSVKKTPKPLQVQKPRSKEALIALNHEYHPGSAYNKFLRTFAEFSLLSQELGDRAVDNKRIREL
jgi:hypothetical protein